jgi:hypothetical protein
VAPPSASAAADAKALASEHQGDMLLCDAQVCTALDGASRACGQHNRAAFPGSVCLTITPCFLPAPTHACMVMCDICVPRRTRQKIAGAVADRACKRRSQAGGAAGDAAHRCAACARETRHMKQRVLAVSRARRRPSDRGRVECDHGNFSWESAFKGGRGCPRGKAPCVVACGMSN